MVYLLPSKTFNTSSSTQNRVIFDTQSIANKVKFLYKVFYIRLQRAQSVAVPGGAGTYGIDAAARKYFGKPARKIDLWQSAILAGLLKAPSRYNPFANINLAKTRANLVLRNMVSIGYVTQAQADAVNRKSSKFRKRTKTRIAPYFVDWVLNQIQDYVGRPDRDLIVLTTLRPHLQKKAENVF